MNLIDKEKLLEDVRQYEIKSKTYYVILDLITNAPAVDSEHDIANLQANITAQEKLGYELQAQINYLREALLNYGEHSDLCNIKDSNVAVCNCGLEQALTSHLSQSLAKHDDELIERCAVRGRLAQLESKVVDIEILALKTEVTK